jgi:hypothetical protein
MMIPMPEGFRVEAVAAFLAKLEPPKQSPDA